MWLCDWPAGLDACRRALALPQVRDAPNQRDYLSSFICGIQIEMGNLDAVRVGLAQWFGDDARSDRFAPYHVPILALWDGDWERAERLWTALAADARRVGSRYNEWDATFRLTGLYRIRGEPERAVVALHELLALAIDGEATFQELVTRTELALLCAELDRLMEAREHLARCRAIALDGAEWRGRAGRIALAEAVLAMREGQVSAAETRFGHAVEVFRRHAAVWDEAETLFLWGRGLRAAGHDRQAEENLSASLAIYETHRAGAPLRERVTAELSRCRRRGRGPSAGYPDSLSDREVEVLRLMAAGKSNREIAAKLVISPNTVLQHVRSIFNKTGAANRTEAATYAMRRGLAD